MLEIFISNQKVDLPADIQIALTIENPFMLQDRVPTPYSLTFDLPPTTRNLRIFNFPNRIASHRNNATITRPCRIMFQSITIASGIVTLTTQHGDISVNAAPGVSASLDAGTTHGRVHNSFRNDGTSALTVRATTAYGDITATGR